MDVVMDVDVNGDVDSIGDPKIEMDVELELVEVELMVDVDVALYVYVKWMCF